MTTTEKASSAPRRAAITATFTLFIAGGVGIGIGSAANAQTLRVEKPFSVKLGGRDSIDSDVGYFYTGVSYAFAKSSAPVSAAGYALYQVYVDYATRRLSLSSGAGSGGNATADEHSVGIGPALTFRIGPQIAPVHPYVGLGVGYYNVKVFDAPTGGRLGGKVFAGLELRSGFLGEVDYTTVGKVGGTNAGGFGARLGYRF